MQTTDTTTNPLAFWQGGGEMGELTRRHDWSATSLGTPDGWPQSLRTTLGIVLNSRFPMFLFWGPNLICFFNDAYRPSLGEGDRYRLTLGQPGAQAWPEIWPIIKPQIDQVMAGGEATWHEDSLGAFYRNGRLEAGYWTYSYSPVRDEAGGVGGVFVTCMETTQQVKATQQVVESEERFRRLIKQATVAIALFSGPQFVITLANERALEYWGRTHGQVIDKPLFEALPEASGQGFEELLMGVYTTGERFVANELTVTLNRNGVLAPTYIDFVYEPFYEADGTISGVMVICSEVTEKVLARQLIQMNQEQLQQSEIRFRSLIEEAPVATSLYVGRDLIVAVANPTMLGYWGKAKNVIGLPLAEVLPELKGQPFLDILDRMFETGETYSSQSMRADLVVDGVLGTYYFNFTYKPLFDETGTIYAILNMAIDVTQQVLAQRLIQQDEERKTFLLQLTDQIRALTHPADIYYEAACLLGERLGANRVGYAVDQGDNDTIEVMRNYTCGTTNLQGLYHYADYGPLLPEFLSGRTVIRPDIATDPTLTDAEKEAHRVLDLGATVNKPMLREGHRLVVLFIHYKQAHDWTGDDLSLLDDVAERIVAAVERAEAEQALRDSEKRYRVISAELEQRVQQRTQELVQANQDLTRSNENLQQFAYVASHDLQEPLRKVQSFSNILEQRYGEQLGEEGVDLLQRMNSAGIRMSTLIRDLLAYSRIATRQQAFNLLSLDAVLTDVLSTLDWEIEQRSVQLQIEPLPAVHGDQPQLTQLFQNLVSNAIKFTPDGELPRVQVSCRRRQRSQISPSILPANEAAEFHEISVRDHGIGFEIQYLDRIFQVFQRLHGKSKFPGTGIGLAICQRVAENHGGGITASSEPGKGATFYVYLPV